LLRFSPFCFLRLCLTQLMTKKISERDSSEELANTFRLFDDDGTGTISFEKLKRIAKGTLSLALPLPPYHIARKRDNKARGFNIF